MLKALLKIIGLVALTFTVLTIAMLWMQSRRVPAPDGSYNFNSYPDPIEEAFAE